MEPAYTDSEESKEDRATTPGTTRLARLADQAADYLARTGEPTDILRGGVAALAERLRTRLVGAESHGHRKVSRIIDTDGTAHVELYVWMQQFGSWEKVAAGSGPDEQTALRKALDALPTLNGGDDV